MKVNIAVLNEALESLFAKISSSFTTKEHKFLAGLDWGLRGREVNREAIAQFIERYKLADADGGIDLDRLKAAVDYALEVSGGYTMHIEFGGVAAPQNVTFEKDDFGKIFSEIIPAAVKKVGC